MSTMTLPASASPYWLTTGHGTGEQHGHDDDVAGRDGAELSRRGAAAEGLGQLSGLGLIAADDLDGVAARYRQRADGAGHVPGADDADAAHESVLSLLMGDKVDSSALRRRGGWR